MQTSHQNAIDHMSLIFKGLVDPLTNKPFLETGRVEGLAIDKNRISFALTVPRDSVTIFEPFREQLEKTLRAGLPAYQIFVGLTAHKGEKTVIVPAAQKTGFEMFELPQIRHIIAVGSGKGGVGKSTVALNLALALKALGLRTGLLDMDLYGPSLPHMIAVKSAPASTPDKKMIPHDVGGLLCMSMGFLVPEEAPLIWRGPMVQTAVRQLFLDVAWPALDVLVLDLPPGTGDTHLSLAQRVPLTGAVIVSTPQDIALLDARKAIAMFDKMNVPILGIVENMAMFTCPHCLETSPIFGEHGAQKEAAEQGVPFLGSLPLTMAVREAGDKGIPFFTGADEGDVSKQTYLEMATLLGLTSGVAL